MTTSDDEWPVVIVVWPVTDPLTRRGYKARDPIYRLKLGLKDWLRAYGLRAGEVRNPTADEIATIEETRP